jgi:hypothetical protein
MKPDESRLALATSVVATAVEELALLPVDVVPKSDQRGSDDSCYWAMVNAEGADLCWLGLVMPCDIVTEIAATVLCAWSLRGADVEKSAAGPALQDRLLDLIGELANTACGAVIRALAPGARFSLGLPLTGTGRPPWSAQCTRDQLLVGEKRFDLFMGWQES